MLLRRITDYILQGRLQAMGTAFACGFIPLIGTVSILIAGLVTLRKGVQEGALVLVAATLPALILYVSFPTEQVDYAISQTDALMMLVCINVLTWLFAVLLRQFLSWSLVLEFAALVSVVAIIVAHLACADLQAWWQHWLTGYFDNVAQASGQMPDVKARQATITSMVTGIAPYATGVMAMSLSFYALLQLLVSRWWQSAMFNRGGLRKELLQIRLSYAAGGLLLISTLFASWGNAWFMDMIPALYLMYALAGLSALHYVASSLKLKWFWLGLIYAGMVIAPVSVFLIAVVGVFDTAFDIRKRLNKRI